MGGWGGRGRDKAGNGKEVDVELNFETLNPSSSPSTASTPQNTDFHPILYISAISTISIVTSLGCRISQS